MRDAYGLSERPDKTHIQAPTNMSKVSIIVPVHNTEEYVTDCVASIQAQTLEDIEIILVENASTDNSLDICHELAKKDERIRVIHLDHGDLSTARNEGVKVASSDYVGFIDSDDTIMPTMFEELYNLAIQYKLDLVNTNYVKRYADRQDAFPFPTDGSIQILSGKEMTTLNLEEKIARQAWCNLYKKELFKHVQFPVDMYYEDRASTFLFMYHCTKAGIINKAHYVYFQRSQSISHTYNFRRYKDYTTANVRRLEFINRPGVYTPEEKARVAYTAANSFISKLRYLLLRSETPEQKAEARELCKNIALIPKGTKLSLKSKILKLYIRHCSK